MAILNRQDVSPINGPTVDRTRQEILQDDSWTSNVYTSLDVLADEGLIKKRDREPETQRTRMDNRVAVDGWRLLRVSGLIRMAHDLAPLF